MATTAIIPLHAGKGKKGGAFAALVRSVAYVENPDKTDGGEWVTAYECDPLTVAEEFMFSRTQYTAHGGRNYGERDVIAYHLRVSFKPGETDAATANKIGCAMAASLTKGRHAYVCCTHTDHEHIHSHVIVNSVSLDCSRKFRNFKGSSFALRRIADQLCLVNGLSVIENPKPSRGSYGEWLGDKKKPTKSDELRDLIDANLVVGQNFGQFMAKLKRAGCETKLGKHYAVKIPGAKKFIRFDSLGEGYTQEHIDERLRGVRDVVPRKKAEDDSGRKTAEYITTNMVQPKTSGAPNMLIDIQAKLREGKGEGYRQWATIFNIKAMSKTLIWLRDNNIDSYDDLKRRAAAAGSEYNERVKAIKAAEEKLKNIAELQKQIGVYGRTRGVWEAYKKSGRDKAFFEANRADLTLHKAAKKYFDSLGYKNKLPSINSLKQEYAVTLAEKKKLYSDYKALKQRRDDLLVAHGNAERMLSGDAPARQASQRTRDCGAR
jgi:hypothetical protein